MDDSQVWALLPSQGISAAESNEQQRNWDDKMWDVKTHTRGFNYDRTRSRLNFEIAKGGVVQPIDTSHTIGQRMWEMFHERNIDPYKKKHDKRKRLVAEMIFQGSRKQMHRIAFGEQQVDLTRGADNSHIIRSPDIEKWALDIYQYVAGKFGEENIVGFYVHLDEVNPHCHVSVVPMTPDNEVNWKYWFSRPTKEESSQLFLGIHDEIAAINKKWGLKRGRSIKDTGAKHVSRDEYLRQVNGFEQHIEESRAELGDLYGKINKAKKKVKSFTTMLDNLNRQKALIESKLSDLKAGIGADPNASAEEIAREIDRLCNELDTIVANIKSRKADLAKAKDELEAVRRELHDNRTLNEELQEKNGEQLSQLETKAQFYMAADSMAVLGDTIKRLSPTLTPSQRQILDNEILSSLTQNGEDVMNCAVLLFAGYVDMATQYVESHGGNSGPGTGWRKRDDEDERAYAHRCLSAASKMMGSRGRSRRR